MDGGKLALELLKEVKCSCKRWFIAFIIALFLLFSTNIVWLYNWCLPTQTSTESYDIDSSDNGNAVYNNSGEVNVDGKN